MTEETIEAVALRADGYSDPLPVPSTTWRDKTVTWLPAGQRRILRILSVGKTVTGWQASAEAWVFNDDGRPVDGLRAASIYLDTLIRDYGVDPATPEARAGVPAGSRDPR